MKNKSRLKQRNIFILIIVIKPFIKATLSDELARHFFGFLLERIL